MKFPGLTRAPRILRDEASTGVAPAAVAAARQIRGDAPPSIMLFGVMPRAGTVHVGELLSLHPDVGAHPNQLWELPFLENTDTLLEFQEGFFNGYHQNTERMGDSDFLAIFGASFVRYLYSFVASNQTVLVKETSMKSFERFPRVFPDESLLLLMRDGRDLVSSSVRTWPTMDFAELCQRWSDSTHVMLDFVEAHSRPDYWLVKFEEILDAPDAFVREACRRYGLAAERYPFEEQDNIEVIGSSTMSVKGQVDWDKHVAAPKGFKPTGHWRKWSEAQKRTFKKIAGAALVRAGYAENLDW